MAGGELDLLAPALGKAPRPITKTLRPRARRYSLPRTFARFAPRTAYDMLTQVPGFTIRSADDTRGLGEASENVLINGQRVTDKSGGGATAQLQKVPAGDVERIEIKEAASLGIAGLTGQVADVILKADRKASGTYSWSPQLRPHFAKPRWLAGSVSYSGTSGALGYTLSLEKSRARGDGRQRLSHPGAGRRWSRSATRYIGTASIRRGSPRSSNMAARPDPGQSQPRFRSLLEPWRQFPAPRARRRQRQ
jgi:hypothetical protein